MKAFAVVTLLAVLLAGCGGGKQSDPWLTASEAYDRLPAETGLRLVRAESVFAPPGGHDDPAKLAGLAERWDFTFLGELQVDSPCLYEGRRFNVTTMDIEEGPACVLAEDLRWGHAARPPVSPWSLDPDSLDSQTVASATLGKAWTEANQTYGLRLVANACAPHASGETTWLIDTWSFLDSPMAFRDGVTSKRWPNCLGPAFEHAATNTTLTPLAPRLDWTFDLAGFRHKVASVFVTAELPVSATLLVQVTGPAGETLEFQVENDKDVSCAVALCGSEAWGFLWWEAALPQMENLCENQSCQASMQRPGRFEVRLDLEGQAVVPVQVEMCSDGAPGDRNPQCRRQPFSSEWYP